MSPSVLRVSREQLCALQHAIREPVQEGLSDVLVLAGGVCREPSEFQVEMLTGGIFRAVQQALHLREDRARERSPKPSPSRRKSALNHSRCKRALASNRDEAE